MTVDDLDDAMTIENTSFPTPWTRQVFESELRLSGIAFFLAAKQEGQLIGYGGYRLAGGEMHITTLAVVEEQRGKGIGHSLMCSLIEQARTNGADKAILEVRRSNLQAQKLYLSLGFTVSGERKNYYQNEGEDALIMEAQL